MNKNTTTTTAATMATTTTAPAKRRGRPRKATTATTAPAPAPASIGELAAAYAYAVGAMEQARAVLTSEIALMADYLLGELELYLLTHSMTAAQVEAWLRERTARALCLEDSGRPAQRALGAAIMAQAVAVLAMGKAAGVVEAARYDVRGE